MEISGNVRWHGTKIIRGDVTVLPSARLVITPGTKIMFAANSDQRKSGNDKTRCELIVKGVLIAQGEIGNKIIFTSESKSPRMGDWYGILFQKVTEQSILDYCIVEYGYDGIIIKKSKIQVSNSEIRFNYHSGISIEVKSNPKISRNIISENDYAGVICTLGSFPMLTDNLITLNSMGIVVLSSSQPNLGRTQKGSAYNPGRNRIMQNEEYDVYNHSNKDIYAENNLWSSSTLNAIAANVFDSRDDGKYGTIDFNPLYKEESSQEEFDNLLLLAQNAQVPQEETENTDQQEEEEQTEEENASPAVTQPVQGNNNPIRAGSTTNRQGQAERLATNTNNTLRKQDSAKTDNVAAKSTQGEEPPLLASSKPESGVEPKETVEKNVPVVPQIDYNNIFLEAFLDNGKKEYVSKESVKLNEIIRRTMQSGVVRVQVVVGKNGKVESANLLKGFNDVLDEAALRAAEEFVYKPGTVNNIPVRFRTIEVFVFSTGSG